MKEKIQNKIKYYTGQYDRAVDRYIDSGKLIDRLSTQRLKERLKTYKEIVELIKG